MSLPNTTAPSIQLLDNASANGGWRVVQFPGTYCLAVCGTFGGATFGLDMEGPDNATAISVEDDAGAIAITDKKAIAVMLPAGTYRGTLTGGTPSGMYASLDRISD